MLAPACAHCGCKVIGHGVESGGTVYCCAHCAHESGVKGVVDNAAHAKH
jgi:Prokaryotic metallothionein.